MNWTDLTNAQKIKVLNKEHVNGGMSINRLAKEYNTYVNKIVRDARKLNITVDDRSKAQKKVLKEGVAQHPTAGKQRTDEEKHKIAISKKNHWDNLPQKEKDKISKRLDQQYKNQTVKMHQSPEKIKKIQEAAVKGSKLEVYLYEKLHDIYHDVRHQVEHELRNDKFHIDIFIGPNIAIEVDGPSHFEDFWGSDTLSKTQEKDNRKVANCIEKGFYFISVINDKKFSIAYGSEILAKVTDAIDKIIEGGSDRKILCRI